MIVGPKHRLKHCTKCPDAAHPPSKLPLRQQHGLFHQLAWQTWMPSHFCASGALHGAKHPPGSSSGCEKLAPLPCACAAAVWTPRWMQRSVFERKLFLLMFPSLVCADSQSCWGVCFDSQMHFHQLLLHRVFAVQQARDLAGHFQVGMLKLPPPCFVCCSGRSWQKQAVCSMQQSAMHFILCDSWALTNSASSVAAQSLSRYLHSLSTSTCQTYWAVRGC